MPTRVSANWTFKNRYIQTGGNELGFGCAVTDPDGTGVIENVYIKSTASSDKPAIWVNPRKHVGHLLIKNVHIEGHADNAIYSENAPPHGAGGTQTIRDCYLHDNRRAMLRINGGTTVQNVHVHNTGNNFPSGNQSTNGGYSWYRGSGDILMEHVQIDMGGRVAGLGERAWKTFTNTVKGDYGSQIPHVTFRNSQVRGPVQAPSSHLTMENTGSNPQINPPRGVPMTAAEARNGTSSATGPTWEEVSDGSGGGGGGGDGGTDLDSVITDGENELTVRPL